MGKNGIAEIEPIAVRIALASDGAEGEPNPAIAMDLGINIKGLPGPPPAGWRDQERRVCALCSLTFEVDRLRGIIVKPLKLRSGEEIFLTFCDPCGSAIAEGQLIVFAGDKASAHDVGQAMCGAAVLRGWLYKGRR